MTFDEEIADRCEESCADQGVAVALDDAVIINRVVSVVRPHIDLPQQRMNPLVREEGARRPARPLQNHRNLNTRPAPQQTGVRDGP